MDQKVIDSTTQVNNVSGDDLNICLEDLEDISDSEAESEHWPFEPSLVRIRNATTQSIDRIVHKVGSAERYMADKIRSWTVCGFQSLPKWLQDNDFLHFGHRPQLDSYKECAKSVFRMHTETLNIWTHLIGCAILLILSIFLLGFLTPHFSWIDKLVVGAFFFGCIVCLGMSAAFHIFSCHSPETAKIFSKLDYLGIVFQITGSFIPWVYYGFFCQFYLKLIYFTVLGSLCAVTVVFALWDKFGQPKYRPLRAIVFIIFGLSGIFPGVHVVISINWADEHILRYALYCAISMGVFYILGAFFYAMRIPERYFPGKCDYVFQSHQIFHIFVVVAAIVYLMGVWELANHRIGTRQTCS